MAIRGRTSLFKNGKYLGMREKIRQPGVDRQSKTERPCNLD